VNLTVHATAMQEVKSDDMSDDTRVVRAIMSLQTAILTELPKKMKEDAGEEKMSSEWKFVAMVVDRLCFYVFAVSFVVAIVVFACRLF